MKVRNIPKWEEFERLKRENPEEYKRLYRESMECLNRATTRNSYVAIALSVISIILSILREIWMK